jgi:hypothetical protein
MVNEVVGNTCRNDVATCQSAHTANVNDAKSRRDKSPIPTKHPSKTSIKLRFFKQASQEENRHRVLRKSMHLVHFSGLSRQATPQKGACLGRKCRTLSGWILLSNALDQRYRTLCRHVREEGQLTRFGNTSGNSGNTLYAIPDRTIFAPPHALVTGSRCRGRLG